MNNVSEEMRHLNELARRDPGKRFAKLWENLTTTTWLSQAWEQIRRNKGSNTAGVDGMTAADVDLVVVEKLVSKLKAGAYRPTPVRRVHIPKTNGKTRPLGIPTIEDRIVQQGLRMLLEPIFEADFLSCSHGFRQGRSTHSALRDVVRVYAGVSWIIEGDIQGCFDNIPHGKLLEQIGRRVADEKVLHLIGRFLKAGYLEDWKYHRTYSGTPQGGILSPLLANIFLHQLDEFMTGDMNANRTQTKKEEGARVNPESRRIKGKLERLRRKLRQGEEDGREIVRQLRELERQRKVIPYYARDRRHPGKVWYVRYADDFVILVAGNKQETEAIKERVRAKLFDVGLSLSEEKTKLTHWNDSVHFLGYRLHGKQRAKGVGIRAILGIPEERRRQIEEGMRKISGYHHIPEVDVMLQLSAMYRGWCNYYKYANSPQPIFNRLAHKTWWMYAHYNARKHKASIRAMLQSEEKAGRYGAVRKGERTRVTFSRTVGKKRLILDIFPPKTDQIKLVSTRQSWDADLKPFRPLNWQAGRSLATRLEAEERSGGVCERCRERPMAHVHHTAPMRAKNFLQRVQSDSAQRYTAVALCKECHLDAHEGSFAPKRARSGRNAGCGESRLSGVVSAP